MDNDIKEIKDLLKSRKIHWAIKSRRLSALALAQNFRSPNELANALEMDIDTIFEYYRLEHYCRWFPRFGLLATKEEALDIIKRYWDDTEKMKEIVTLMTQKTMRKPRLKKADFTNARDD